VEFRVLGPFEVVAGDRSLELGGSKQRAVLAMLALRAGRVVSTDALIDGLWGDAPPATAAKSLQVYVSRLRKALGDDVIATRAPGYVLTTLPDAVDALRAEALLARARDEAPTDAASTLSSVLELWRGAVLADLADEPFASIESARLEELRLVALEDRIDAELELGRHRELVPELELLSRSHPYRERTIGQCMLALYRSGRQAEALDAYRAARGKLADDLGLEPGAELRELERKILSQDASLAAPRATSRDSTAPPDARRRRRAAIAAACVAIVAAVVAMALVLVPDGDRSPIVAVPNSIAFIDPVRNEVGGVVPLDERPTRLAVSGDDVWVLYPDRSAIAHVNQAERRVLGTVGVGGAPSGIVADARGVWVADARTGRVTLIEPERLTVVTTVATRRRPIAPAADAFAPPHYDAGQLALGFGALWVASGDKTISRIDARTLRVTETIPHVVTGQGDGGITVGEGSVWVAGPFQEDPVTRIDPRTNTIVAEIPVAKFRASGIVVAGGSVWVSDVGENNLWRIDPARNIAVATVPVGVAPLGVAFGHGSIWVANSGDGTVSRIDPVSGRVTATIVVGGSPNGLAVTDDGVLVTVG
jgi:YVTN family beta-propeller protein